MKILFVSPTYRASDNGAVGGGEKSNILLMEWLAKRGHEVVVVAKDAGLIQKEMLVNGVRVIAAERYQSRIINFVMGIADFKKKLRRCEQCFSPDVVLTATDFVPYAVKFARRLNVPVGVFIRAYENFEGHATFSKKIKSFLLGDFHEKGLGCLDFAIPNSKFMDAYFKARVPGVLTQVIYPPVDVAKFPEQGAVKEKYIVMVGTSHKKGISTFIQLAKDIPHAKFKILGAPSDLKVSELPNLTVSGWVDVIAEFQHRSRLVLVPSLWAEPFGRVAVEALLSGVPVLVSDKGGLPEAVGHNQLRVVSGSYQKWRERVEDFLNQPRRYDVSDAEVAFASDVYSMEHQGLLLESFLQNYSSTCDRLSLC